VRDTYDVVVIGSGFGGAVVACRLAQAGRSVLVLERGRRWTRAEFPRAIGQVADQAFWEEGRSHGFLEYLAFNKVDVIQGAGVGGGSLHYFNVNLRADARIFADPRWPAAITRAGLDPYYDLALDTLGSRVLEPPPGRTALPERTVAFLEAGRRAGYDTEAVAIAVHATAPSTDPATGVTRNPCTYCGNCLFGCDVGAKNTLDTNYLALAERVHGAEIAPLHVVDSITPAGDGYDVAFRALDPDPRQPAARGRVHGTTVVVAAGAIGSTGLLLTCRDGSRTLPALPAALGRRFSLNGESLFAFAHGTADRTDPGLGPPITGRTTLSTRNNIITVQDLGLPDAFLWYLEGAMPPAIGRMRGIVKLLGSYLRHTIGVGSRTSRVSLELDALLSGGRTPRAIPFLGMGTDSSDGRITGVGNALEIEWSRRRNRGLNREMRTVMTKIAEAAGGHYTPSFLARWPMRKTLTAHPLGGCAMGDDRGSSVVDHRGEVWAYPGLFVIDGSMIPTALAVNPSLTIAALAERAAHWMVHNQDMSEARRSA
jgi:cholesterol oxidase